MNKTKVLLIFGGVYSSLGKGVIISSIAQIFSNLGHKVSMIKFDPYLNINPGVLSPLQHGEVFIMNDGSATDLDLGNYERFLNKNLTKLSGATAGRIYNEVINQENPEGKTIQIVPDITNKIKEKIYTIIDVEKPDYLFIEIGGTVGDLESVPFEEALSQFSAEYGRNNVLPILCSPLIKVISGELKTKPTQQAINTISKLGIPPQMLVLRTDEEKVDPQTIEKLSLFCHVNKQNIFVSPNLESVYSLPHELFKQDIHTAIYDYFSVKPVSESKKIKEVFKFIDDAQNYQEKTTIYMVGQHVEFKDPYMSIIESLRFACWQFKTKPNLVWVDSDQITSHNLNKILQDAKGILLSNRISMQLTKGEELIIKYARENNIPFLGIDKGMHAMLLEFALNALKISRADLIETNDKKNKKAVIKHCPDDGKVRIGAFDCVIQDKKSLAYQIYNKDSISQRHHHDYCFNNEYKKEYANADWRFSCFSDDANEILEIAELSDHSFFVGVQFHPEFLSRPTQPEPIFIRFVSEILKRHN